MTEDEENELIEAKLKALHATTIYKDMENTQTNTRRENYLLRKVVEHLFEMVEHHNQWPNAVSRQECQTCYDVVAEMLKELSLLNAVNIKLETRYGDNILKLAEELRDE